MADLARAFGQLTPAQRDVLARNGWKVGSGKQPPRGTVQRMLELGLLLATKRRFMRTEIVEYFVPDDVRKAWAEFAGEKH